MSDCRTILYLERNIDGTIGGSYRSLLYLVKLLPKDRWRPIVIFYRDHELVEEFRKAGCRVLLLEYPRPLNLVGLVRWRSQRSPVRRIVLFVQKTLNFLGGSVVLFLSHLALLRRERVDLVHLNNGVMGAPELLVAGRFLGVKTVVHQRGIEALPRSFQYLRRCIDYVICVSDAAREALLKQGLSPERSRTVHNGIDPEEFKASILRDARTVRTSLGLPDDAIVVGNAGMIREWKGQLVLVEAMARLQASHPKLYCVLVGGVSDTYAADMAYAERVKTFVKEHHLSDRVRIVGYQPRIAEFIQIFDVMVHSSIDPEPFSRSILEGMSLGRALVGTRTGGTPEAIKDGVSGLLVAPNDADAMSEAIDRLLRSPALSGSFGRVAERRVREEFSITTNVESTLKVYEELLTSS